jgi:hypothetical protein
MTRRFMLATITALSIIALGGSARAATPFGGDDAGFIPPDRNTLRYESTVGRNLANFQRCVLKCHGNRAHGRLTSDTSEAGCEEGCESRFDLAHNRLVVPAPAATCLGPSNRTTVRSVWESILDGNSGTIYCAGTTPVGGDDSGFIAPDAATFRCESGFGRNAGTLLLCVSLCHAKRAGQRLGDDTAEDSCESSCMTKYNTANGHLRGCPPCVNPSTTASFGSLLTTQSDSNNGLVYCAQ